MAGNFWQSSHCNQWVLDNQSLLKNRQADLAFLSEEEYQKVHIFYASVIQAIGEQLNVRQQVIATATMYFKRVYSRYSLKSIDPLLLGPTCLFLAAKVEVKGHLHQHVSNSKFLLSSRTEALAALKESGAITNSKLQGACQSVVKKFGYAFKNPEFRYKSNQILECEFYLLELLDCCLIVYHPYRPLIQYVADLGQEEQLLPLAWKIVNDSLRTDVCLLYPPYLIALACLHMACVISQKDTKHWFAELNVDLDKVLEITQQILKLYDLWKNYDEREEITAILEKVPKPQLSPPNGNKTSSDG